MHHPHFDIEIEYFANRNWHLIIQLVFLCTVKEIARRMEKKIVSVTIYRNKRDVQRCANYSLTKLLIYVRIGLEMD